MQANDASSHERTNISVHISLDGAKTWPFKQYLEPRRQGGYAVVDMVAPNIIGVLYERAQPGACIDTNMTIALVDARDIVQASKKQNSTGGKNECTTALQVACAKKYRSRSAAGVQQCN